MTANQQIEILEKYDKDFLETVAIHQSCKEIKPVAISVFQMNMGTRCNMACKHCHVNAGPLRTENMKKDIAQACLDIISTVDDIETVDITGGAPEMNENFELLVTEARRLDKHVIDRCNLTILEEPDKHYLYDFLPQHQVEVVASLPHYNKAYTDKMRGDGTFKKSIKALQQLNSIGYGKDPNLKLNLVYNPVGLFLGGSQKSLEQEYKQHLKNEFGIEFNNLFVINNMPIGRFLDALLKKGQFERYMEVLAGAFNAGTLNGLMCLYQISVGYDGRIYDCDFNQMLEINANHVSNIKEFDYKKFMSRTIRMGNHCYGCTAGSGSSCGGEIS